MAFEHEKIALETFENHEIKVIEPYDMKTEGGCRVTDKAKEMTERGEDPGNWPAEACPGDCHWKCDECGQKVTCPHYYEEKHDIKDVLRDYAIELGISPEAFDRAIAEIKIDLQIVRIDDAVCSGCKEKKTKEEYSLMYNEVTKRFEPVCSKCIAQVLNS